VRRAEQQLRAVQPGTGLLHHMERFLHHQDTVLHPAHAVLVRVKQRLGHLYQLADLSRPQLERKLQVCEEAATALAKVDCSLVTRWRPGLQAEINRARAALQLPAREIQPPATSL